MLDELRQLLTAVPKAAAKADYRDAIVAGNCLGKRTLATRKATSQRLAELYGLDRKMILFRALRQLWHEETAQPSLALLLALARDPLLRASASSVISTPVGHEFARQPMKDDLAAVAGARLSPPTLDTVVRNTAASWTQSGHLRGRSRKTRQRLRATPASTAYALLIGYAVGYGSQPLYDMPWLVVLDVLTDEFMGLILGCKMLGLLEFKHAGNVMDLSFPALVTRKEQEFIRESHR